MIWDSNYSMWIEDDSVKTTTAGTTAGTDAPVLRRAYCSPKNNYINDLIQPEAIPIEWLRKYVDEHDEIVEEGLYWIVEEIIDDWRKENETR